MSSCAHTVACTHTHDTTRARARAHTHPGGLYNFSLSYHRAGVTETTLEKKHALVRNDKCCAVWRFTDSISAEWLHVRVSRIFGDNPPPHTSPHTHTHTHTHHLDPVHTDESIFVPTPTLFSYKMQRRHGKKKRTESASLQRPRPGGRLIKSERKGALSPASGGCESGRTDFARRALRWTRSMAPRRSA